MRTTSSACAAPAKDITPARRQLNRERLTLLSPEKGRTTDGQKGEGAGPTGVACCHGPKVFFQRKKWGKYPRLDCGPAAKKAHGARDGGDAQAQCLESPHGHRTGRF